jgi:hypothetical protein
VPPDCIDDGFSPYDSVDNPFETSGSSDSISAQLCVGDSVDVFEIPIWSDFCSVYVEGQHSHEPGAEVAISVYEDADSEPFRMELNGSVGGFSRHYRGYSDSLLLKMEEETGQVDVSYDLSYAVTCESSSGLCPDAFEGSDDNDDRYSAYELPRAPVDIDGAICQGDEDWYLFEPRDSCGMLVGLDYDGLYGQLRLELWTSGTLMQSGSSLNWAFPESQMWIRVLGPSGGIGPYSMDIREVCR